MADGEINRNGATIRIDDDGGVQVEPADGQEVEYTGPDRGTDAIRESVNTESLTATESVDLQTIPVGDEGSSLRWAQFDSEVNSVNYRSTFKHAHREVPADTSTEIVDVSDGDLGGTPRSAFVLVNGRTPGNSDEFFDVVAFVHNESPDVISTNNRSNVPSRSYSATASALSVTVTDEKAAIAAIAIAGGADANP